MEAGAHLAGNAIERLRASEKLKENEERIVLAEKAAFLGESGNWILRTRVLTLSQELATQVGLPDAAHQLTVRQLRAMIHRDDWPEVLTALKHASASSKPFHAEVRIVLDNGLIRWLRTQASVEFADHRPKRMMGFPVESYRRRNGGRTPLSGSP